MVHNMNQIIKCAGCNVTIDETTWANSSYADVHSCIIGKPTASNGGQHVVCLDSQQRFIYAYTPWHKFMKREPPFTQEGPTEVKQIHVIIKPLIVGNAKETTDTCCQIFDSPPCLSMDNHFSGDEVLTLL